MTTFSWLFVLIVGILVSFLAGRMAAPRTGRLKAMQEERDAASAELQRYKEDVSAHFEKTATLFNEVTGSYRNLYEHLAEGSQRLGVGPDANLLQSQPERRRLESAADKDDVVEGAKPGAAAAAAATTSQQNDVEAGAGAPASTEGTEPETGKDEPVTAPEPEETSPTKARDEHSADEEAETPAHEEADAQEADEPAADAEQSDEPEEAVRQPSDYAPTDSDDQDPARRRDRD